jgi:hypothetical protein
MSVTSAGTALLEVRPGSPGRAFTSITLHALPAHVEHARLHDVMTGLQVLWLHDAMRGLCGSSGRGTYAPRIVLVRSQACLRDGRGDPFAHLTQDPDARAIFSAGVTPESSRTFNHGRSLFRDGAVSESAHLVWQYQHDNSMGGVASELEASTDAGGGSGCSASTTFVERRIMRVH